MILNFSKNQPPGYRKRAFRQLKILWAAHYFLNVSDQIRDIAKAINVNKKTLRRWVKSPEWEQALQFWGVKGAGLFMRPAETPEESEQLREMRKSLRYAQKEWNKMIEDGEHICPNDTPSTNALQDYAFETKQPTDTETYKHPFLYRLLSQVPTRWRKYAYKGYWFIKRLRE